MTDADELAAEYFMRPLEDPLKFNTEQMWQLHRHELNPYMRGVYLEIKLAWLKSGFSKDEAERAAREAVGFENPPRFLNSPPVQDGPDRVSPLEAVAGFAVVGLVFVLIFWGV